MSLDEVPDKAETNTAGGVVDSAEPSQSADVVDETFTEDESAKSTIDGKKSDSSSTVDTDSAESGESTPPPASTPEEKIAELEVALADALKENQYKEAEIRNAAQRAAKERSQVLKFGASGLARRLIVALENLDRAISISETNSLALDGEGGERDVTKVGEGGEQKVVANPFIEGVRLVRKSLFTALEAEGVKQIETTGTRFDPAKMEAIATIPAPEGIKPGCVVEALEKGWMHHDRVLRAARVVVASE
jgi:molecular chaperone GrpE (heat shock protein)